MILEKIIPAVNQITAFLLSVFELILCSPVLEMESYCGPVVYSWSWSSDVWKRESEAGFAFRCMHCWSGLSCAVKMEEGSGKHVLVGLLFMQTSKLALAFPIFSLNPNISLWVFIISVTNISQRGESSRIITDWPLVAQRWVWEGWVLCFGICTLQPWSQLLFWKPPWKAEVWKELIGRREEGLRESLRLLVVLTSPVQTQSSSEK